MKYTLLIILCVLSIKGFTEKVSIEKAKKIAENWGVIKMNRLKGDIDTDKKLHFVINADTSLYVFNFINRGFVIVPSDDNSSPILGYSTDNHIDIDIIKPDLHDWVTAMANHFYYTTPTSSDHWNEFEISSNTSGFKNGLRSSLNNGYPILFRYDSSSSGDGHLVVIDGYENDEFFHFSMGWGGAQDAYYYLFSSDYDGFHLPRPHINLWGLDACMNIRPNCPPPQDRTVTNIAIPNGGGSLIQSGNDLLIDHVSIQSGGRAVLRADNSILISSDFEVALGGEILMICKPCNY